MTKLGPDGHVARRADGVDDRADAVEARLDAVGAAESVHPVRGEAVHGQRGTRVVNVAGPGERVRRGEVRGLLLGNTQHRHAADQRSGTAAQHSGRPAADRDHDRIGAQFLLAAAVAAAGAE
ncbi:hypothetical protein ABZX90_29050 [Streptomyces sp. NPDC002935]|uniref:hypothetical protein n=1 Tax=Streptomyces sp. NPDC002935 TaxID=3154545 RepID=UPI0033B8C525